MNSELRTRLLVFLATVGASTPDDHPWVVEARELADAVKGPPPPPRPGLRCPHCRRAWATDLPVGAWESCPLCHLSFSFRKPYSALKCAGCGRRFQPGDTFHQAECMSQWVDDAPGDPPKRAPLAASPLTPEGMVKELRWMADALRGDGHVFAPPLIENAADMIERLAAGRQGRGL